MNRDIDVIAARVRERVPDVVVRQLIVSHPGADDDGLWFFKLPNLLDDLQLESTSGNCPFLIEHSLMGSRADAVVAESIESAVNHAAEMLSLLRERGAKRA